jgi:hypothetical protein
MTLSESAKQKLAALLPDGYDVENARVVIASGTAEPLEGLTAEEEQVLAEVTKDAKGPRRITDGRPTLMRVVAWMVHEGVNRNRDAFVKEELQQAAGKINPSHPLVMDWNHSAVLGGSDKVIGVWTKAEYAFDQKAKDGKGAWGILVEGVMFAWLYPDIADTMLADQSRKGAIEFSMACIPASVEFGRDEQGSFATLHNPVFFTNSGLDVPPGDPDAKGLGKEGADTADALRQQLTANWVKGEENANGVTYTFTNLGAPQSYTATARLDNASGVISLDGSYLPNHTISIPYAQWVPGWSWAGEHNIDALAEKLAALIAAKLAAQGATMTDAEKQADEARKEAERVAAEAEAARVEAERLAAEEAAAAAAADVTLAEVQGKVTELETANTALRTENDALAGENTKLAARVAELEGELAVIKAKQAEVDAAAKLATRLAELPESYLTAHDELPDAERLEVEKRWMALDDAAWTDKVADITKAVPKTRIGQFLARTRAEGRLPAGGTAPTQSIAERVRNITRA